MFVDHSQMLSDIPSNYTSGLILSLIRAESRIKRPVAVLYNLECRANISMVSKVFQIQFGEILIRTFRYDEGLLEMDFLENKT